MAIDIITVGWIVLGIIVVLFLFGVRVVRPVDRGLVERLGKYKRLANPGFHWIIPLVDRMIKVNITEQMVDSNPQEVITMDNLNARVDLVVYFQVKDSEKDIKASQYNVNNYRSQIVSLARTTARNVIGNLSFEDTNSKRHELNTKLEKDLDKQTEAWGIRVVRVELKEIDPPKDVQERMNNIIKAEKDKKAAVDFAQAAETKADGDKRASIKIAQGKAESIRLEAKAEADAVEMKASAQGKAIELINTSAAKYFKGDAQLLKKLEVAESSLASGTKYIVPSGSDIVNVISEAAGVTPLPKKKK
ncbi:SPFH/Band 7/PHB domain protein [Candidatus Woesearchaeota archaeon]|nr:SPFH/Band 7/PHB domain protein [Candidatus Woesearchaeota archaeon]